MEENEEIGQTEGFKIEARKKGMIVREKTLPNGAVQLSIGKL